MKNTLRLIVILGLASATFAPMARANDAAPTTSEQGGKHRERMDELRHMIQELNLSDAQKDQVKGILKERRKAIEALPEGDRRGPKAKEVRETYRAKIRAVLTPEQQAKFDAMKPEGHKGKKKD